MSHRTIRRRSPVPRRSRPGRAPRWRRSRCRPTSRPRRRRTSSTPPRARRQSGSGTAKNVDQANSVPTVPGAVVARARCRNRARSRAAGGEGERPAGAARAGRGRGPGEGVRIKCANRERMVDRRLPPSTWLGLDGARCRAGLARRHVRAAACASGVGSAGGALKTQLVVVAAGERAFCMQQRAAKRPALRGTASTRRRRAGALQDVAEVAEQAVAHVDGAARRRAAPARARRAAAAAPSLRARLELRARHRQRAAEDRARRHASPTVPLT